MQGQICALTCFKSNIEDETPIKGMPVVFGEAANQLSG
jgi:hypothetical protein